jgi:GDP-L-fucose synthase
LRVLITGSTGFVGSSIVPILKRFYDVDTPSRSELNLLEAGAVEQYFRKEKFDVVVHLANPTAQNPIDRKEELLELSLRVFTSLAHCSHLFGKMIYLGSGAEYGKHRALVQISEEEFGKELPKDAYGLSRYIMNDIAAQKTNITNLRLFACCGPNDPPYKLIQHAIGCIERGETITQRQNMLYDFLYVEDIAYILRYFVEHEPLYKAYNLCSGTGVLTGDVANEVRKQLNSDIPIVFENETLGLEYTASNERLRLELPGWKPTPIEAAVHQILLQRKSLRGVIKRGVL